MQHISGAGRVHSVDGLDFDLERTPAIPAAMASTPLSANQSIVASGPRGPSGTANRSLQMATESRVATSSVPAFQLPPSIQIEHPEECMDLNRGRVSAR